MSAEQNVMDAPVEQRAAHDSGDNSGEQQGGSSGDSGQFETDENGQRVPHGMGQSKSSRRRRRKRKGKGEVGAEGAEGSSEGGSSDAGSSDAEPSSGVVSTVQAAAPQQNSGGGRSFRGGGGQGRSFGGGAQNSSQNGSQNNGGGGQQDNSAAPGGTKRWKKKFRDRNGRPQEGPGNNQPAGGGGFVQQNAGGFAASSGGGQPQGGYRDRDTHQPGNGGGGGGFKRKGGFGGGGGKQQSRGPRSFVGPMDHSYRAVNGNFAETPPSTIEPHGSYGGNQPRRGGYQGDSQPIDYSQGRTVPIAADAPTHIYFFIEDLFFIAKIQETARKLGVKVAFVKNEKDSLATLTTGHEEDERQILVVFDLNNANAKPLTLIPKLKTKMKKTISIIGFLSHLQGDLKAKAVEAGCNTVMPRAAFSQNLPNLLRRYGIEEAEEANFNN